MRKDRALLYALASQILWGLLPVYWKLLSALAPYQILVHRILWSAVFLHVLLSLFKGMGYPKKLIIDKSHYRYSILGGLLVSANWLIYIYSVNTSHVLEASLGYYMLPLIMGLLGFFMGEKLSKVQYLAYAFAAVGVFIEVRALGRFPLLSFVLALTFALYTVVKKKSSLNALDSLYAETVFVLPLALVYLFYVEFSGMGISGNMKGSMWLLLSTAGIVTALPLLLYGHGARGLPMSVVAFIQYISPTITFLLGVFVYHESFGKQRLLAFLLIWTGVLIFTLDQLRQRKKKALKQGL